MQPVFDDTWRQKVLRGDDAAAQLLIAHALKPLYAFCLYRVGKNQHWCEEVVQETMLRGLRELASYEPARAGNNIVPWLIGLARNEIQRILHREKATVSLHLLWADIDDELRGAFARLDEAELADEVLRRQETHDLVHATLAQLPDHYRESLEEKYIQGRSQREMAECRGTTEKALESLLTRARQAFRETFLALSRQPQMETV